MSQSRDDRQLRQGQRLTPSESPSLGHGVIIRRRRYLLRIGVLSVDALTPNSHLDEDTGDEIGSQNDQRIASFGTQFVGASRGFGILDGVAMVVPMSTRSKAIREAYIKPSVVDLKAHHSLEDRPRIACRRQRIRGNRSFAYR